MFFQLKLLNLFLLLSLFILCHSNETSTIPTTLSPTTSSLNISEELQKVAAFNKAMTDIIEVFESDKPFIQNLKKLMDASRMCGIIFNHGVYSWEHLESQHGEISNAWLKIDSFYVVYGNHLNYQLNTSREILATRHSIFSIYENIIVPIQKLTELFKYFQNGFKKQSIDNFKDGCKLYNPEMIIGHIRMEYIHSPIFQDDYSDQTFESFKTIFQNSLKLTITMLPLCKNFLLGKQIAPYRVNYAADTLKELRTELNRVFTLRKIKMWENQFMEKFIKNHAVNAPYAAHLTDKKENYKIEYAISYDLTNSYGSLGYNYHVVVSDAAQLGHNDTLIQCSTECHYLYNFLGKDVYVMRSQKADNYLTCQQFEQKYNGRCNDESNSTYSLEPIAKDIADQCKENITAISLIKNHLHVENTYYSRGFSRKCYQDINIVLAFKPLVKGKPHI